MKDGPSCVVVDRLLRAWAVPGVAVAPFEGDFVHVVVEGFVAVAEDWLLGGDAVVAGPERACAFFRLQLAAAFGAASACVFEAVDYGAFQPGDAGFNRCCCFFRWIR